MTEEQRARNALCAPATSQDDPDHATPPSGEGSGSPALPEREDVSEASTVRSAEDASLNDDD